jgi:hypothetical protein
MNVLRVKFSMNELNIIGNKFGNSMKNHEKMYWFEERFPSKLKYFGVLSKVKPDINMCTNKFYYKINSMDFEGDNLCVTIYREQRISFDVCAKYGKYTHINNQNIIVKCKLNISATTFLSKHEKIKNELISSVEWLVSKRNNGCSNSSKKTELQEMVDIYPSYEIWIHDYEYGGCSYSSDEDDDGSFYVDEKIDRYKKIQKGIYEHYVDTIQIKKKLSVMNT